MQRRNSISSYSEAPRGLSVLLRVTGIFTGTTISPSLLLRQCSDHYAFRAGRNLPDKEFRYLRTLQPFQGGWVPADEAAAFHMARFMRAWPDSLTLMIRSTDPGWTAESLDGQEYNNCYIRRVCFEPGLETIKNGILAMNDMLDTVVIPDYVKRVGSFAFGCCSTLNNLVIEGDLSRIADWAEDAFEGCPCEGYYKQLRNRYRQEI